MNLRFVFKNIWAHKLRTVMTVGAVSLAVFLLCILQAIVGALGSATSAASNERLWVQSAVSLFVDLPLSYESKIASVEGVERICKYQWFGGYYQDESNFFAQFAVDPETLLDSYPEMVIDEVRYENFAQNRNSCLVGVLTAEKFGLQVGDQMPITGRIFSKADGSAWTFEIAGIFSGKTTAVDEQMVLFHFDVLKEAIEAGEVLGQTDPKIGVYMIDIEDDASPSQVSADIDELFENGPQKVQTTTEAEFTRQFVSMLGSVPLLLNSIGGGVVFAIFFAVLNTMLMAGRERTRDYGVLKALGFSDGWVFRHTVIESVLICTLGGVVGVLLASLVSSFIAKAFASLIPGIAVDDSVMVLGFGLALLVGILAGAAPARRAASLKPVEALRAVN